MKSAIRPIASTEAGLVGFCEMKVCRLALEFPERDPAARSWCKPRRTVRHVGSDVGVRRSLDQQGRRQGAPRRSPEWLRIGLGHRCFAEEVDVVVLDQPLVAGVARHPIARDRIGDRPADDHKAEARIDLLRASELVRGISGIARPQHVQPELMSAAGGTEPTDAARIASQPRDVGLEPSDAEIDVGDRGRIGRSRRHAKIERKNRSPGLRDHLVDHGILQPVVGDPRAAMHVHHGRGNPLTPRGR